MSGPVVAIALAVVFGMLWAVATVLRSGKAAATQAVTSEARFGLRQFADQSLGLQSVPEILAFARNAAGVIFGCQRVLAFERGAAEGSWEASIPGGEPLGELPVPLRGLFGWFRHNTAIAVESDLGESRFGAMRGPLRQVFESYGVDVLLPLVSHDQVLAVLGMKLDRKPTAADRELMRLFRLQCTAACANVRLHAEAAHMVSLAKEVDLAGAVKLALVPDHMEGSTGPVSWAGYYQAVGGGGSDFWGVYRVGDDQVMVLIGDAIGAGLAGSMVSAVVKSCADAIFDTHPDELMPAKLLGALNRALYRSQNAVHTSCFALLIDVAGGRLSYANAGHPFAYHRRDGSLGVLSGSGPLLGDEATARYRDSDAPAGRDDTLVLFTNGLVQAANGEGKAYGERKLQKVLAAAEGDAAAVRDAILASVNEHRGQTGPKDDAGLLVLRL